MQIMNFLLNRSPYVILISGITYKKVYIQLLTKTSEVKNRLRKFNNYAKIFTLIFYGYVFKLKK